MKKKYFKLSMVAIMVVSILVLSVVSYAAPAQNLAVKGIAKEVPALASTATPEKQANVTTTLLLVVVFAAAVNCPAYDGGGEEEPAPAEKTLAMAYLD